MYQINKKQKVIIAVIVTVVASVGYYFYNKNNANILESENLLTNSAVGSSSSEGGSLEGDANCDGTGVIVVHISGAVNNPGVIEMKDNNRIKDAIDMAGGLKEDADLTNINLAEILEDASKIYIPQKGENIEQSSVETTQVQTATGQNAGLTQKQTTTSQSAGTNKISVNINTASKTELQTLPGVGPSTAEKILEYRNKNGKFSSIEDIKKVSGIGESKFNKIKECIRVK